MFIKIIFLLLHAKPSNIKSYHKKSISLPFMNFVPNFILQIWNFYSQRELKSVPNWSFRVISNIKRLFETLPNWIFRRERQFKITPNLFPIGFFESFLKLNFCSKLFPIGFFHAYSPHDQIKREKKCSQLDTIMY